jgi:peptidoglycan/xylan/chitin deacetylase (PgdA/CDA1 family)
VQTLRRILTGTLLISGFLPLARRLDRNRSGILRVLLYHRIADRHELDGGDPMLISASPGGFARQMGYLVRHYTPITVEHLIDAIQGRRALPPRAVLVTFDDGYRDFLTHAWPVLQAHHVPAVVFVPTAFPDTQRHFWWDIVHATIMRTTASRLMLPDLGSFSFETRRLREIAIRHIDRYLGELPPGRIDDILYQIQCQLGTPPMGRPPVLCWDELRSLARGGLAIAPHTRNHPTIPALSTEEITEEIQGAQADLSRELRNVAPVFSFPFGRADPRALPQLRAQGIIAAFTAFTPVPVLNVLGQGDPLLLRREAVNGRDSSIEFRLNLTTAYATLQSTPVVQMWRGRVRGWLSHRGTE